MQLATEAGNGVPLPLTTADVDRLFTFSTPSHGGGAVRLADLQASGSTYTGAWVDARRLSILATVAPSAEASADSSADGEGASALLHGGSGLAISVRHGQTQLRLQGTASPWLDGSAPLSTSGISLGPCLSSNETSAEEAVAPQVSFRVPVALTPERLVCLAPLRSSPVVADLELALNGQASTRRAPVEHPPSTRRAPSDHPPSALDVRTMARCSPLARPRLPRTTTPTGSSMRTTCSPRGSRT